MSEENTFFPTHFVKVIDNTAGHACDSGAKLEIIVVSDKFDKVPLLQRHRLINDCLSDLMPQIHALSMKTWTIQQHETNKQKE